ncbi:Anguibactin system regulator [Anatilimnocola aggregata]|uniref:Anguibactin system regulator n=1 Tax=Anatilimnocola aggregata TaxID=2528021 RepID=A0A517YA53_9BACT|nr:non-ribosomal peptide synthetase [Anatilimnocola aggregata]QDU27127.1 Anguibactin system regulator [Anatilimnocola aggregata]
MNPSQLIGQQLQYDTEEEDRRLPNSAAHMQLSPRDSVSPACLHHPFLLNAERNPQAIAVVCGNERVTYQELEERSASVAQELLKSPRPHEELIGLDAARTVDTLVGMIGILRAQAAYLPIDPSSPESRIKFFVDDSELRRAYAKPTSPLARCVDQLVSPSSSSGAAVAPLADDPSQLAYVLYTSGSTGTPKGVMIEHGAAMNTILDINRRFQIGREDRVLGISPFGFDLSVYDVFGTFAAGGCLVLATMEEIRDPRALFNLMQRERVTVWNSVPAQMELLLRLLADFSYDCYEHLRLVMLSGDWISLKLPERLMTHFPRAQLISLGGATEVSIWSCFHRVVEVAPDWKSIPYGRPLSRQYFRILDAQGEDCIAGEAGELLIGGDGVARGYLNRPELTAERFITEIGIDGTPERLYRTGDLGRYMPDGTMEFLGRIDHQVKINGYRIELGEIESQLIRHPDIREAVVVARRDVGVRLIAYVVPRTQDDGSLVSLTNQQLRLFLASTLPDYMLPSDVVAVPQFCLTANGKVDRSKLPEPPTGLQVSPLGEQRAASPLESQVAAIFARELRQEDAGVDTSFFTVNGDSLTAMSLGLRLEKEFGVRLPMAVLMHDRMTPRSVAKYIQDGLSSSSWESILRLQPEGQLSPLFCLPGIDGHLLKYRHLAQSLGGNRPVFGLQPPGLDDLNPPESIEEIAAHYVRLIRRAQPEGPYRLLGFSLGGVFTFEAARQLQQAGQQVSSLILLDSYIGQLPRIPLSASAKYHLQCIRCLPRGETWSYVWERCRVGWIRARGLLRGIPKEQRDAEVFDLAPNYVRIAIANARAARNYAPQPLACSAHLLRASRQLPQWDVGAQGEMGWTGLFQNGLTVQEIEGSHRDLLKPWNIPRLAETIRSLIEN